MRAMLGHDHADRRQLRELMATEPPPRMPLLGGKLAATPAARLRIVIDDLIHLILRPEPAPRAPMPRLTAHLALLTLPAHQLLSLRARRRPPLSPRLRRIPRRRSRTRARILPRLLLQPPQPILMLLNPGRQLENELNTCLPPRVINRLRLDTIHDCKIRCANKESLPQAPTTERLRGGRTPSRHVRAVESMQR
jgi:hypothetical protein